MHARYITTRGVRHGLIGALLAVSATVGGPPGVAGAASYWPMTCQGPLAGARVAGGTVVLRARAGRRAAAPTAGECVWRDRAVDRPGEHRGGFLEIELPAGGVQVRREGGRREVRFTSRALQRIWDVATRGGRFTVTVRRTGDGRYEGRVPVVAEPLRRDVPRAKAAPSRRDRPEPRPSGRDGADGTGARVTARPAPPPPPPAGTPASTGQGTGGARGGARETEGGVRVRARPLPVRGHCIPIDPFRMRITAGPYTRPAGGGWVWTDPNTTVWRVEGDAAAGGTVAAFRERRLAEQTLRVLRELRANQYCGTKFPHPAMTYLLISGRPPAAPPPGVDCGFMNRARLAVERIDGRWTVIEYSPQGRIFWFNAATRNEAHMAIELIRRYRFGRYCRIGRGEEAFVFLTR